MMQQGMNRRKRRLQATREKAQAMGLHCDMCSRAAVQFVLDTRDFASFVGTRASFAARCERHLALVYPERRTMSAEEFLAMKVQES